MPIQFPKPSAAVNIFSERLWLQKFAKAFDVVPAPNLGNPGAPLQVWQSGGPSGYSLDPGIGKGSQVQVATNMREFKRTYRDPTQTAVQNPARPLVEIYDTTQGFDRVLGAQNARIIGRSLDASGNALGNCMVFVFQTASNVLVAQTTSDGSGNWTAYPNQQGPYYFVEYKAGSPDVFGTSLNTNTATQFTPGQ